MNKKTDFKKKRLEEIKQTKFLNLMDFGDLLGYNKFKKEWDFQEIINSLTDWHKHTGFFEIYHNDIHFDLISITSWELQKDFKLWKCNGVKFYHFKDWLSYILILSLNNIPKNLKNQFENGNLKDPHSEDSLFCTDKNGIVELVVYEDLKNFLDEEISNFLKILTTPPNLPNESRVPFSSRNKEAIKYLFELLQTNKSFVKSLLAKQEKADNVLKYFPPDKSDFIDADSILEVEWQSIQRFLTIKKLALQTVFENEDVECFIQNKNGVYKKILGLGKALIPLGRKMFFGMVSNVAFEEKSGEELLEKELVQIFVSCSSAIKFSESLSEDVRNFRSNAGRPKEKNYYDVWKDFIEKTLFGEISKHDADYAQMAFAAYNKLTMSKKNELKFTKLNGTPHKDSILITIQGLDASNGIGKTSLTNEIVTPFANKFSSNSTL